MKAITLWQPWASLIACGAKKFETRSWAAPHRGPIAIHAAAKRFNTDSFLDRELYPFADALGLPDIYSFDTLPYGSVIAIAKLVDCFEITGRTRAQGVTEGASLVNGEIIRGNELFFGDYTPGRFAWKLENVQSLAEPIPAKGRQCLWNWDEKPHLIAIDPYVCGDTQIWTPKGIITGRQVDPGKEDSVRGLEVRP